MSKSKGSGKEQLDANNIRKAVREGYAKIAKGGGGCCGSSGCGPCESENYAHRVSGGIGYSEEELNAVPEGANLGLGCGNPTAFASLREGDTVLDLGSGAGLDCFLAAAKVGKTGKVIGVDMTPEMIHKARENTKKGGYGNVEFRLGEIEHLPVADNSVDAIISNCVINLAPDKKQVFQEAFRVLRLGGRLMISDIVLKKELPDYIKNSIEAYVGCVSGAMLKREYVEAITTAGFQEIEIIDEIRVPAELWASSPVAKATIENLKITSEKLNEIADSAVSIKVRAVKPPLLL
ncbi:MAG: arsenite methyltransferase [Candidatus Micrarchaeota archaeon]